MPIFAKFEEKHAASVKKMAQNDITFIINTYLCAIVLRNSKIINSNLKSKHMATIIHLIKEYQSKFSLGNKKSPMSKDLEEAKGLRPKAPLDSWLFRCVCNRERHQWCLSTKYVNEAVGKLKGKIAVLEKCSDFETLYDTVYDLIGKGSTGISYSTVYDTSIRLGNSFNPVIHPDKYVYVHRHLIQTANKLLGRGHIECNCRILRSVFDKINSDFKLLNSLEIEDFLCIYSDELLSPQEVKNKPKRKGCGQKEIKW